MSDVYEFLVIGYGNTLRRDDGVGVKVAEAVAALNLPGVNVITRHQLVPELAGVLSQARAVIFVDAAADADADLEPREVQAGEDSQILAHAADPRSLLALSTQIFGRCPPAWCLAIPVQDFGFGDGLSAHAEAGLQAAVQQIRQLAGRLLH
ncbi:MAG: hydrogenase maturation protease [Verrucomicrobiota bacterium]|jgi:hydrogenase maturation protease